MSLIRADEPVPVAIMAPTVHRPIAPVAFASRMPTHPPAVQPPPACSVQKCVVGFSDDISSNVAPGTTRYAFIVAPLKTGGGRDVLNMMRDLHAPMLRIDNHGRFRAGGIAKPRNASSAVTCEMFTVSMPFNSAMAGGTFVRSSNCRFLRSFRRFNTMVRGR